MTDSAEKQLIDLKIKVDDHNARYYVKGNPIVSDKYFDELLGKVHELEVELGYVDKKSPTQNVGDDRVRGFAKVKHNSPMLSIGNTYSVDDLKSKLHKLFMYCDEEISFVAEPKIDGIAISLTYQDGNLIRATTRGNGREGDDVTTNIKTIESIPRTIDKKGLVEIRGEAYMDLVEFNEYNEALKKSGEVGFANARNACAGTVKNLDVSVVRERPLRFIAYTLVEAEKYCESHMKELELIRDMKFNTLQPIAHGDIDDMAIVVREFRNGQSKVYATDGVVIRVNESKYWDQLGNTNKSPRWMVAFKCEPEVATTHVLDIELTIGRTGVFTPVAILETTLLAGTEVSRASLHNFKYIREKDLRIGDLVDLVKAGEIIPQVGKVYTEVRTGNEKYITIPKRCPHCEEPLFDDGTWIRCKNDQCPALQFAAIEYFASKGCMDIVGLGPRLITLLIDSKLIGNVADIYRLTGSELMDKAGFGEKSALNLIEAIALSKGQDVSRVLRSLGIQGIGEVASDILIDKYGSIDAIAKADIEELSDTKSIGELLATAIYDYFDNPVKHELLVELGNLGLNMERVGVKEDTRKFERCVVTGVVDGVTRDGLRKLLRDRGILLDDRITKTTDYLLLANGGENSGKHKQALKMNLPIHTVVEFLQ